MFKDVTRDEWCAALRSGKYLQVKNSFFGEGDNTACAVGVLLRISGMSKQQIPNLHPLIVGREQIGKMVGETWLGITTQNLSSDIIQKNDFDDNSFNEIADFIENAIPAPIENARLAEEAVLVNA